MPTTFANTIDGNEILAKRSQCDYAGNDIQTTYATKSELPTATSDLTNDSDFITSSDIPVKDVQVGGTSVVNAQGIAEISIPQTGVLDVEVDGSSVVNAQGVAEIVLPTFTQVNADWDATSGVSEILNKPDLSIYAESSDLATVATSGSYNDLLDKPSIPSAQVNADWDATSGVSAILNKPSLATVATTGDYSDLQNLPSIPAAQVNSDWNATSGVAQIFNKPSIPTATSDLTNDSNFITLSDVPAQVNADWNSSSGASEILNKPTIPTVDQSYSSSSTNAQSGVAVAQAIAAIPSSSYTAGSGIEIVNNEISVVYDSDTLEMQQTTVTHTYDVDSFAWGAYFGDSYGVTPQNVVNQFRTVPVTVHIPANTFYAYPPPTEQDAVIMFRADYNTYPTDSNTYCATPLSYTFDSSTGLLWLDEQDVVVTALVGNDTCNYFSFGFNEGGSLSISMWLPPDTLTFAEPVQFSYPAAATPELAVKNPLPASTSADEGKVLKVDANGDPEWGTGGGGGSQVNSDWDATSGVAEILNKPVPKTLTAGTGISITESASTITIANTAPDLPLGSWEDVSTEAQYNTTPVLAGGFAIKYNAMLKLVSVSADVNLAAGAANIFTWSNRLKPVANSFALGNGLDLYVSQTSLNQPSSATNRWVNGVWMWPVVGE